MPEERIESILAADCGSAFTKAVLIDKVDGEFRLIAIGEALTTPGNVAEGLAEAVRDVEAKARRKLLRGKTLSLPEGADGNGVDAAVLACSAGAPVRLICMGISPGQVSRDASEAAVGAMADVVALATIQDVRHKEKAQNKLVQIQEAQADAVLLVSGAGSDNNRLLTELSEFIAKVRLVGADGGKFPAIVAGDTLAYEAVSQSLASVMELRSVGPIRNGSGRGRSARVTMALNEIYFARSVLGLPGLGSLTGDSWKAVLACPTAIESVAHFVARHLGTDVLLLDIGATTSKAVAVVNGSSTVDISTNCGLGPGIFGVLNATDASSIARWLPYELDGEGLMALALNRGLRPQTISQLPDELMIDEAIARVAIAQATKHIELKPGLVIATGGFFPRLPRRGRLMLLLLDALQPVGVTNIAFDSLGLFPALGAVAAALPQAAGEVIVKDSLQQLGTAVSLEGSGKEGQPAAHIKVQYAEGGEFEIEVPSGGIEVIPLAEGQTARLLVQPGPDFRLGGNPKGRQVEVDVKGGAVGVVIDARGRPLQLPADSRQRLSRLSDWYRAMDL